MAAMVVVSSTERLSYEAFNQKSPDGTLSQLGTELLRTYSNVVCE